MRQTGFKVANRSFREKRQRSVGRKAVLTPAIFFEEVLTAHKTDSKREREARKMREDPPPCCGGPPPGWAKIYSDLSCRFLIVYLCGFCNI